MSELKKITIDGVEYDLPSGGGEGGYIKPDDGIPKSDLNQSVQDSLDKAETALQSFTETDPTVPTHVKSITETDISNWNDKAETSDIPNVPDWALEETKPTYTASEVGALPEDTVIPEQLTEADILDMGFTKNTGTYIKPESGIPKSDLSEEVQDSLDKAETDPTVPAHVKSITETDISNWNDKQDKLTAGDNITIEDGVISATGGSGNANIWVGTQEEWDALDKSTIEDGTEVHIIDDAGDVTYKLIKTYDDLMNNTDKNKLVDALVVKKIVSEDIPNVISDAYDSSKTYSEGQYCIYNNTLWKSKVDNNLGNTPVEGTYWTATNISNSLNKVSTIYHTNTGISTSTLGNTEGTIVKTLVVPEDGFYFVECAMYINVPTSTSKSYGIGWTLNDNSPNIRWGGYAGSTLGTGSAMRFKTVSMASLKKGRVLQLYIGHNHGSNLNIEHVLYLYKLADKGKLFE